MPPPAAHEHQAHDSRVASLELQVAQLRRALYALLELLAWAAMAAPAALLLLVVRRPDGILWPRVFDVTHAIVSGAAALVALRISRRLFQPVIRSNWAHYLIALVVATTVGLALEVAQLFAPGDASWKDLARDVLGALAALACALSIDSRWPKLQGTSVRWGLRVAALLVLLRVAYPVTRLAWLMRERSAAYPLLASFESPSERPFVYPDFGATLERISRPSGFANAQGEYVGQVTFAGGSEHPKLEILALSSDWSEAQSLAFDVYSPQQGPVQLSVRVDAEAHDGAPADRFTTTIMVPPGSSTQRIPIDVIRGGTEGREMNLRKMRAVLLFLWKPSETAVLAFDTVRLEY